MRDAGDERTDEEETAYWASIEGLFQHQRASTAAAEIRQKFREQAMPGPLWVERPWRPSDVAKGGR